MSDFFKYLFEGYGYAPIEEDDDADTESQDPTADANAEEPLADGNADADGLDNLDQLQTADDNASEPESDDEVISVDDLTDAQEKMNKKINQSNDLIGNVDKRINSLLASLDNINSHIQSNNKKIEDLEREIKERIPDDQEKLNTRSINSYPYNEKTDEFIDKHGKDGNYHGDKEEYTITDKDANSYDKNTIADSFNADDYKQDLISMLGI